MSCDREYVTQQFRAANKGIANTRAALRAMHDTNGPADTPDRRELRKLLNELTASRATALRKLFADGAIVGHLQQEQSEVDEDPRTAVPT